MIVDPDFPDHWKTRMLIDALDGDRAAPVYLLRLWAHCQNRRKWQFVNLSPEALKALCCFPGHANKLDTSLVASGFVRREEDTLIVIGWEEYNAALIANWTNGAKGGRPAGRQKNPPVPDGKPMGSPRVSHGQPLENRLDEIRVDKKGGDNNSPPPPLKNNEHPPPSGPTTPGSQAFARDPLTFQAKFTAEWNKIPGVAKARPQLSVSSEEALRLHLLNPRWDWLEAMRMLQGDPPDWSTIDRVPSISWFLKGLKPNEDNTVDLILDGRYTSADAAIPVTDFGKLRRPANEPG